MSRTKEVPDGFEVFLNYDKLPTFLHEGKGIVIDVAPLDRHNSRLSREKYRYRVSGARNQKTFYSGAFPTREAAEDKALELAKNRC